MLQAAIILQARTGSTRLPAKVLAPIGTRSILGHCIERLAHARVAPVVVATTTEAEDKSIVEEAQRLGVRAFRGDRDDVLSRFIRVARELKADVIVRATADNPAVDMDAAARCLRTLRLTGADYVVERGLPYGAAVEAVRTAALEHAYEEAADRDDREHVTLFVRRHRARFRVHEAQAPVALARPDLRFTVDTAADLAYMRAVITAAAPAGAPVPLAALMAAADRLAAGIWEGAA